MRIAVLASNITWNAYNSFGGRSNYINADRLVRVVGEHPSPRVRAYWAAVATRLSKDRRFARLEGVYQDAAVDLLFVGTGFQIERRGEDERFTGTSLRVPAGSLRDREADVLRPEALVRLHPGYRNRVRMGPSWRADVWTVLEREPEASVAEAARRAYCAFATAWQVAQDFHLWRQAGAGEGAA